MTDNSMYRIAADGINTGYGPYSTLSSARNVASQVYGGCWSGRNSQVRITRNRDFVSGMITEETTLYTIQKLTPVLKQIHPSGAFALQLEWVDLDG